MLNMKKKLLPILCGLAMVTGVAWAIASQAAVSVYGVASSSGEFVTARAYANITGTPVVSFSVKVFYDRNILSVVSTTKNEATWHLADGTRRISYMNPNTSTPGEVLIVGARLDSPDPLGGVLGNNILLGTVVFGRLHQQTPKFELAIGRAGDYASFVTTTGVTLESLPGEVIFSGISPTLEDQDLDGLQDLWEIEYFTDIRLAFYSDDPDRDGASNQQEEALGSDPNDRNSNLRLQISRQDESLHLDWMSFTDRTYTIEESKDLENFMPLVTGIKATPPLNSYKLNLTGHERMKFYRILLQQQ